MVALTYNIPFPRTEVTCPKNHPIKENHLPTLHFQNDLSNEQISGCVGYIRDNTIQLCGEYPP